MDNTALFTAALQLECPWQVTNVELLPEQDRYVSKKDEVSMAQK